MADLIGRLKAAYACLDNAALPDEPMDAIEDAITELERPIHGVADEMVAMLERYEGEMLPPGEAWELIGRARGERQ